MTPGAATVRAVLYENNVLGLYIMMFHLYAQVHLDKEAILSNALYRQ